jgi:tRNA (guanine37-N1)-methyltransferase
MLMKAKPVIDAVESFVKRITVNGKRKKSVTRSTLTVPPESFRIIYLSPSKQIFTQKLAHTYAEAQHIIFVCGRYEGIDHRFVEYMQDKYPENFETLSLGKFITLGGEAPAMTITEAIVRLVPGVIKEAQSRQDESYSLQYDMKNIEYPQYTRPEEVYGYKVPEILFTGHHKNIDTRRKKKMKKVR